MWGRGLVARVLIGVFWWESPRHRRRLDPRSVVAWVLGPSFWRIARVSLRQSSKISGLFFLFAFFHLLLICSLYLVYDLFYSGKSVGFFNNWYIYVVWLGFQVRKGCIKWQLKHILWTCETWPTKRTPSDSFNIANAILYKYSRPSKTKTSHIRAATSILVL